MGTCPEPAFAGAGASSVSRFPRSGDTDLPARQLDMSCQENRNARAGAGVKWTLERGFFRTADEPFSYSNDARVDGVLVYQKTSADLASGGRALRITATSFDDSKGVMLEVTRDVCDPTGVGGGLAALPRPQGRPERRGGGHARAAHD